VSRADKVALAQALPGLGFLVWLGWQAAADLLAVLF